MLPEVPHQGRYLLPEEVLLAKIFLSHDELVEFGFEKPGEYATGDSDGDKGS